MVDGRSKRPTVEFDVVVVGAGLIGLATARELLAQRPELRVAVVDKADDVAAHQSGHNSGVIHAGIYYTPGSLKARLCVAGSASMRRYCEEREIEVRACGKLIVATTDRELRLLADVFARGQQNGVPGIELIGPERLRELEPHCQGLGAVWSPTTSIVDYVEVARAYARDIVDAGGVMRLGHEVTGITTEPGGLRVMTPRGEISTAWLVGCAGLWADRLARLDGGAPDPGIVPFRGSYWRLRPDRAALVDRLIYPVPDPRFPFLGVHFTPRISGEVWLGPNALLAAARDGYRRRDVRLGDLWSTFANPAFRRFARKYWRTGVAELAQDLSRRRLLKSLRRYVPELRLGDIEAGPSGIRAQALTTDARLLDDFAFDDTARGIHVRNAPSPAATSSLELGRLIADRAIDRMAAAT